MARLPRLVIADQPHHIIQRGTNRQAVCLDDEDRQRFLGILREAAKQFKVAIHAYCLMSNHVHLLASPSDTEGLARMMQWLGRKYVPYFNGKYGRVGGLFQGRFRTSLVDSEQYFLVCSRYIELNPVRAGMVQAPLDYPWSSYAHHVGQRTDPLIVEHGLYWALGNTPFQREAAYRELAEKPLTEKDVYLISEAVSKGWPLGTAEFTKVLEQRAKRQVGPGKRGRPPGTTIEARAKTRT